MINFNPFKRLSQSDKLIINSVKFAKNELYNYVGKDNEII